MGERRGLFSGVEGTQERKRPLENEGVDGKIILKWIFKKWERVSDRIDLAQNRDRGRV
jgi:hypothetical protein